MTLENRPSEEKKQRREQAFGVIREMCLQIPTPREIQEQQQARRKDETHYHALLELVRPALMEVNCMEEPSESLSFVRIGADWKEVGREVLVRVPRTYLREFDRLFAEMDKAGWFCAMSTPHQNLESSFVNGTVTLAIRRKLMRDVKHLAKKG